MSGLTTPLETEQQQLQCHTDHTQQWPEERQQDAYCTVSTSQTGQYFLIIISKHYNINWISTTRIMWNIIMLFQAKAVCSLSVLFGLSWGFGILGFFTDSVILSYLFALTTTLQGFFFFIFFILMKNDLRQILWKRMSTFRGDRVNAKRRIAQTRNRTVLSY